MVADFVSPRARWPQGTWQARARGVQFLCQAMTGWFRKTGSRNCYIQYIYLYIYGWWFLSKKYARHLNQLYENSMFCSTMFSIIWLVISTPLKNISQVGWLFPRYGKIKNVPNHQLDIYVSYQTTKLWSPSLGSHGCFEIYIYSKIGNLEWHCWKKKHIVW
jgi:hypothetical protein